MQDSCCYGIGRRSGVSPVCGLPDARSVPAVAETLCDFRAAGLGLPSQDCAGCSAGLLPQCVGILKIIVMDKKIIGVNAGKVWHALKDVKEITIPELARRLNLSVESTALAIGWLARENKVCVERKNGIIEIYDEDRFSFIFG